MFRTAVYVLIIGLVMQIYSSVQCMKHQKNHHIQEEEIIFSFNNQLLSDVIGLVKEKSDKTWTYILKPNTSIGFKKNDLNWAKSFYFVFGFTSSIEEKDPLARNWLFVGKDEINKIRLNAVQQLPWQSAKKGIFVLIKSITPEYNTEGTIKRYIMHLGFKIDGEDENPFNAIYLYSQESADDDDASSDWGS